MNMCFVYIDIHIYIKYTIYMTNHPKMRRFSKTTVGRVIAYLDRADSDGNDDASIVFII